MAAIPVTTPGSDRGIVRSMSHDLRTGGCQCGAVRFAIAGPLGRASICHCRMCQKAFGNAFGPLVTAPGVTWTRGTPKRFRSSNRVSRGFCGDCGTPLSYEPDGFPAEIAIGAFDDPASVPPVIQVGVDRRLPWFEGLPSLPTRPDAETAAAASFFDGIVSNQHPDCETER